MGVKKKKCCWWDDTNKTENSQLDPFVTLASKFLFVSYLSIFFLIFF